MRNTQVTTQEFAEDLYYGQNVITTARWFVVGGGIIAALWLGGAKGALLWGIAPFLLLMLLNFWLRARQLAEKPANQLLVWVTSVTDLLAVTTLVLFFGEARGLNSPFFVFYYPLVLGFALVMPPRHSIGYAALASILYVLPSFMVSQMPVNGPADLVRQVVTLGAVAVLGTLYWRAQRSRRRAAAEAKLDAQVATRPQ